MPACEDGPHEISFDSLRKRDVVFWAVDDRSWALMPGYSGTPLPKKLGIKEGHRVLVQRAGDFVLRGLPADVRVLTRRTKGKTYDVILAFCRDRRAFDELLPRCVAVLPAAGSLWICWPKKSSGLQTDLGEADVRQHGLAAGVVDVKICAIDDIWSGLKFMVRTKDRARWAQRALR